MTTRSTLWPLRSTGKVAGLLGVSWPRIVDLAGRAGGLYTSRDRQILGKSKWRHVDIPDPDLLRIQRRLNRRILQTVPLPANMFGSAPGRGLGDHVRAHQFQRCVVTLDLRDFFPSTEVSRIYSVFADMFGCPQRVAAPLTQLVTLRRGLPQGAPTSPLLAHLAVVGLMEDVKVLCDPLHIRSSCYMDDIALSGAHVRQVIEPIILATMTYGQSVGVPKKRVMGATREQLVTGCVLTRDGLRVPHQYIDHVLELIDEIIARGRSTGRECQSLRGKIAYVASVCARQADPLRAAMRGVPDPTAPGQKRKTARWEPCKGGRRCRASRQRHTVFDREKEKMKRRDGEGRDTAA